MSITYHPFGDRALLLQWEQRIDPDINAAVIRLHEAILDQKIPGLRYAIPAYCSLTLAFQPEVLSYEALCEKVAALLDSLPPDRGAEEKETIVIPVCYEGEYAPDLDWLSRQVGLSAEQIIQIHTSTPFRVFLLGFMPGFPYLGILPKVLEAPRKTTPRLRVPAGSVALAGLQTGIYPIESPGGWQLIGRTPRKIFNPEREPAFLLRPGDRVRFEAIDTKRFKYEHSSV